MPEATALEMLRLVKRIVREQQRCPNCDGRADDEENHTMLRLPWSSDSKADYRQYFSSASKPITR